MPQPRRRQGRGGGALCGHYHAQGDKPEVPSHRRQLHAGGDRPHHQGQVPRADTADTLRLGLPLSRHHPHRQPERHPQIPSHPPRLREGVQHTEGQAGPGHCDSPPGRSHPRGGSGPHPARGHREGRRVVAPSPVPGRCRCAGRHHRWHHGGAQEAAVGSRAALTRCRMHTHTHTRTQTIHTHKPHQPSFILFPLRHIASTLEAGRREKIPPRPPHCLQSAVHHTCFPPPSQSGGYVWCSLCLGFAKQTKNTFFFKKKKLIKRKVDPIFVSFFSICVFDIYIFFDLMCSKNEGNQVGNTVE
eukprot:Rhum_TRINITY_DN14977_c10_g1::Rhum_TRINITY_DN14977_c10_g1_i1::g.131986::m.131986